MPKETVRGRDRLVAISSYGLKNLSLTSAVSLPNDLSGDLSHD